MVNNEEVGMVNYKNYKQIYNDLILQRAASLIIRYDCLTSTYTYDSFSHDNTPTCTEDLIQLIINDMVFYAFSEDEVLADHEQFGLLDNLHDAAKFACTRIPRRDNNVQQDGTTGEILLDILIQILEPEAHKLIARAKYKQFGDVGQEIKGYDALYFTNYNNEVSLYLGQVKTGAHDTCRAGLKNDLETKYVKDYFCRSMFYIADKSDNDHMLNAILKELNRICFLSKKQYWSDDKKYDAIGNLLKRNNVKIKIPCLMVFSSNIYNGCNPIDIEVSKLVAKLVQYFDVKQFPVLPNLESEIDFLIFPVKSIETIREKICEFRKE